MSGSENKAWDDGAEKPAEVVRRRGVEPGSYGGLDVVARSMDLVTSSSGFACVYGCVYVPCVIITMDIGM